MKTIQHMPAVRALVRLYAKNTEGWAEWEAADAQFDGGEFSGALWARKWEREWFRCLHLVADRFGIESRELADAENEAEYRWVIAMSELAS